MTHWLNDVKWRALAQLKRKVRKDHRRFLFILLGPAGKVQSYHEVGRAMASSFADEVESLHFLSSHICDMNYSIAPIMCVIHHKTEIIQLKMYLFHSVRNLFKHRPENYFPFLCRWQTLTSTYHHVAVIFQDYELGISGVSWGCLQGSQQRSSDCRTRWVLGPGDFNHLLSSNARANFYDYEGQIRQVNE